MRDKAVHPGLAAALEFGPLVAFLIAYLIYRDASVNVAGTTYSGFIAVTAAFVPVFLLSTLALYLLSGRLTRVQLVSAALLLLFAGLGVWFNDPRLLKIKPTVIYLTLAAVLAAGLLRNTLIVKLIMEDTLPMKKRGWRMLTKRLIALFLASAGANEAVWRTQSEATWVYFETLAMPVIIAGFFVAQVPLFVRYAAWKL